MAYTYPFTSWSWFTEQWTALESFDWETFFFTYFLWILIVFVVIIVLGLTCCITICCSCCCLIKKQKTINRYNKLKKDGCKVCGAEAATETTPVQKEVGEEGDEEPNMESPEDKIQKKINTLKKERELMDTKVEYYKKSLDYEPIGKTENINDLKINDKNIAVIVDIPNSHDMWQKASENNILAEYKEGINLFKSIVKKEINMYGGTLVDNGLTNEYLKCSFERDTEAIEFALQLQFLMLDAEWPKSLLTSMKPECAEILKSKENQHPLSTGIFESNFLFRGLRVRAVCAYGSDELNYDDLCDYASGGEVILSQALWNNVSGYDWNTVYSFPVSVGDYEGDDESNVHILTPTSLENRYDIIEAERTERQEIEKARAFPNYHIKNQNFLEYRDILDNYIKKLEELKENLPKPVEEPVKEDDVVVVVDNLDSPRKENDPVVHATTDTPKQTDKRPLVELKEGTDDDILSGPYDFEHAPPDNDAVSIPPISALSEKTEFTNEKLLADAIAMNNHLQEKLGEKEQLIKDLSKKFANALTSVDRTLSAKKRIEQSLTQRLAFYNENMYKPEFTVESLKGKKMFLVGIHCVDAEVLWDSYQDIMKECYNVYRACVTKQCKKYNGQFISQDCEYVVCGFSAADDAIRFAHDLLEAMRNAEYSDAVLQNRYCVQIEQKSAVQLRGPRIRISIRQGEITREDCNITVDKSSLLAQQTEQSATSIIYISKDIYDMIPNEIAEFKMKNVKEAAIVPKGKATEVEHTVALVPKSFMFFDDKSTKLIVLSILQAQLAKTKREITVLSDMVHNAQTTQDLEKEVNDYKVQVNEYSDRINKLTEELDELKNKNNESSEATIAELTNALEKQKDENETLRLENEILQDNDNDSSATTELVQKLQQAKDELAALTLQNQELQAQSPVTLSLQIGEDDSNLAQENETLRAEIESLTNQLNSTQPISLPLTITSLNSTDDMDALKAEINDLTNQLDALKGKASVSLPLTINATESTEQVDSLKAEIELLNVQIQELKAQKPISLPLTIQSDQVDTDALQAQIDLLTKENEELKVSAAAPVQVESNQSIPQEKDDNSNSELESLLEDNKIALDIAQKKVIRIEEERQKLIKENEKLQMDLNDANNSLTLMCEGDEIIPQYEIDLEKAEELIKTQKATIEKEKVNSKQLTIDIENLNANLEASKNAVEAETEKATLLENQLKEANATIHKLGDGDAAFATLESQLLGVQETLKNTSEILTRTEQENEGLRLSETNLKQERDTLNDKLTTLEKSSTASLATERANVEKVNKDLSALKASLEKATASYDILDKEHTGLKETLTEKEAALSGLEAKLALISESSDAQSLEKNQLLEQVTDLKSTIRRLESTLEDRDADIKRLKKTLADDSAVMELETKLASQEEKQHELQSRIDQLVEEKSKLLQEKGALEGHQSASASKLRSIEETIDVYKKRAESANEEYELLKTKMKQRTLEIDTLEDEIAALKKSNKAMKREQSSLTEDNATLEQELAQLKKQYNAISKRPSSPTGDLSSTNLNDSELSKKNSELQYQLKVLSTKTDMRIADLEYKHSVLKAENHRLKAQLNKSKSSYEKKLREKERQFTDKLHKLELQAQINQVKTGYENQINTMRDRHQMELNQGIFSQYLRSPSTNSSAPSTPPQHQLNSPSTPSFPQPQDSLSARSPQVHPFSQLPANGSYQPVDSTHSPITSPPPNQQSNE